MKISITLPSLSLDRTIDTLNNINATTLDNRFEVIVCSPFRITETGSDHGEIIWVEDSQCIGCVAAHWAAYERATGDLITAFADDHSYIDGWDVLAVENFLRRETVWNDRVVPRRGPFSLGLRQVSPTPHVGTMFGIYYPYFPLMRLEDVRLLGGWYDKTQYKKGFSDPDLGLRVWSAGGLCEWADAQTIICNGSGPPDYHDDLPKFLERWAPKYGTGWDLSHVRGWDIDRPVSAFVPEDRTCFKNEVPW